PAHHFSPRLFRLLAITDGNLVDVEGEGNKSYELRKHTLLGPELLERKFAERKVIDARLKSSGRPTRTVQINQLFRVGHRQIAQHHDVHHAEDRRVGANA